jgi:multidrug efflux pump subunit AcrA (membrane-fusion protein)
MPAIDAGAHNVATALGIAAVAAHPEDHTHGGPTDGHSPAMHGAHGDADHTRGHAATAHEEHGHSDREHRGDCPGNHDHSAGNDHAHGAHEGHAHDEAASLRLSPEARQNIGLTLATVQKRNFDRTVSIPGLLVDRPGRSELAVSAPITGVVHQIHPIPGEAVAPGDPLFEMRLTHEDLVEKQAELLRAVEELDVVKREVRRLEEVTRSGAVAGKRLLERQYEQQKIEGIIRAERQALLLHGLDEEQIEGIVQERRLLRTVVVHAPQPVDHRRAGPEDAPHAGLLQVSELAVVPGQHVEAGSRLGTLSDHCELYVEGKAFEEDAEALGEAVKRGAHVSAVVESRQAARREVKGLEILYVDNRIEVDSRALKFYVLLPNELVRDETTDGGHRFIAWRYKPGQRVDVRLPVEQWEQRMVVPVDAVVREGAESYVYQQVGDHFDRRLVHVKHRDRRWAVIETEGPLFPGDTVAAKGAYQIHLALKNKAGGQVDPHAGHHH